LDLSLAKAALLVAGGLVAGVVNTLAGGGSLLTVPLLVLLGLPGGVANGTNRVGVLLQCLSAAWGFRREGVFEPRHVLEAAAPVVAGALIGAFAIARVADATFERLFGVLMLVMLVPILRQVSGAGAARPGARRWPRGAALLAYFGVGLYAGAFQAGVGLPLLLALLYAGHDVVHANAIKVAVIAAATLAAVPVFALEGSVAWLPAALLAAGFSVGGSLGARFAVRGGERVVRPVLAVAVLALAARMLGLF
jgi:uncharacterized membrane protein YfcA